MTPFYRPPADIDDFSRRPGKADELRQNWHDYIGPAIADRAQDNGLFYDAANDPNPAVAPAKASIAWNAFPRSIWQWFNADADSAGGAQALLAAETLAPEMTLTRQSDGSSVTVFARQQDEYCEWAADRNAAGGITRLTFTSEGPEYFEMMAAVDYTLVGDLYRQYVNPAVQDSDLVWDDDMRSGGKVRFQKGAYNKWNKWNTLLGAMHLTHRANTLGAEINLAADASLIFPVPATPANTLSNRLICCAGFGGVSRSSDPLIGAGVNGFARTGKSVTLANPVGLYMKEIGIGGLRAPDGTPIGKQSLRILRASPDGSLILRAEVKPPAGATYTLDQCTFGGRKLTGGGLIAQQITMVLFGLAKEIPGRIAKTGSCSGRCCSRPDAGGFMEQVPPSTDCANISDKFWAQFAPKLPDAQLAIESESDAAQVAAVLSKKRGHPLVQPNL